MRAFQSRCSQVTFFMPFAFNFALFSLSITHFSIHLYPLSFWYHILRIYLNTLPLTQTLSLTVISMFRSKTLQSYFFYLYLIIDEIILPINGPKSKQNDTNTLDIWIYIIHKLSFYEYKMSLLSWYKKGKCNQMFVKIVLCDLRYFLCVFVCFWLIYIYAGLYTLPSVQNN